MNSVVLICLHKYWNAFSKFFIVSLTSSPALLFWSYWHEAFGIPTIDTTHRQEMGKVPGKTEKARDADPMPQSSNANEKLSASRDSYANLCPPCFNEKKSLEKMFKHYYTTEGERTSSPEPPTDSADTKEQIYPIIPEGYTEFSDSLHKAPIDYPVKGLNVIPFDVVTAHFVEPEMPKSELNRMQLQKKWRLRDHLRNLFNKLRALLKPARRNQEKKKLRTKVTEEPAKRTSSVKNNPARTTSEDCVKCAECSGPMDCSSDSLSPCDEDDNLVLTMTDCDAAVCDCSSEMYLMNQSIYLFQYEEEMPKGFRSYMCW